MNESSEIRYCVRCGHQTHRQMRFGRQRPVCPACGHVHFQEPKVAALVLVERDERILLVRRVNEPEQGKWSLPAGFIDAGEDPQQAAAREVLEETGLRIRVTDLVDVVAGREHPRGADILIVYRGEVEGGNLTAGDDADAVDFFPYDCLPPLAFRSTLKAIEAWRSAS